MILIKSVLGNIGDHEWAERLSAANTDLLEVDQWEAQKSRFRKTTAKGVEIAISIDRNTHIRDGDVLLWDAQAPSALVARKVPRAPDPPESMPRLRLHVYVAWY